MKILLTGCAGFIGFHVTRALLEKNDEVFGIDSLNQYYDVNLKLDRLRELGIEIDKNEEKVETGSSIYEKFTFFNIDISDEKLEYIFRKEKFDAVCNLAAQAGVRYSIENPSEYIQSNIVGFSNILENCRKFNITNLSYASSSSVYGLNSKLPFSEEDETSHPISLYAASKKSNELMAHTYSHLYNIPTTGMRFFTAYGPWGRPDMSLFKFVKAALNKEKIEVYNNGDMTRDFTYIDDVVSAVLMVIQNPARKDLNFSPKVPQPNISLAPYKIYNVGNNNPVSLKKFISVIEENLEIEVKKSFLPIQPGDVKQTYAETNNIKNDLGFEAKVKIEEGVKKFIKWYRTYHKIK